MKRLNRGLLLGCLITFLLVLVFSLFNRVSGTSNSAPPLSVTIQPLAAWTDELALKFSEPPSGWRFAGQTTYTIQGMPERYIWFKHGPPNPIGTSLSQGFIVYSTTAQAEQAYPKVRDELIPPAYASRWTIVPELSIQSHADEVKTACLSGEQFNGSSSMACSSIARYQNVIVLVDGIIFEQWLTLPDFRHMLEAVDRRVTNVMSQQSNSRSE